MNLAGQHVAVGTPACYQLPVLTQEFSWLLGLHSLSVVKGSEHCIAYYRNHSESPWMWHEISSQGPSIAKPSVYHTAGSDSVPEAGWMEGCELCTSPHLRQICQNPRKVLPSPTLNPQPVSTWRSCQQLFLKQRKTWAPPMEAMQVSMCMQPYDRRSFYLQSFASQYIVLYSIYVWY